MRSYPPGTGWDASVVLPVSLSAPFRFASTAELVKYQESSKKGWQSEYGRIGNPTVRAVEMRLAALMGAEDALLFASGMAAVTTTMLSFLGAGDHVILTSDCYKRTRDFVSVTLGKFDVNSDILPVDVGEIEKAICRRTRLIFTESPTNPYLNVADLEMLAVLGREHGILTVVDPTFATPVNARPLSFGIDLVIHSCTKYLGGHNDLIAGAVAGSLEHIECIRELRGTVGGICGPETAYMLERGLKTLCLRVRQQNGSALRIAEHLESHPKVRRVFYPGLKSHPHHTIARKQMSGFGGVVSFLLDADCDGTARFVDALEIPAIAPSLGGVESLVEQPALMGYLDMPRPERERLGMYESLVRFAVGIEDAEDLIADIDRALKRL